MPSAAYAGCVVLMRRVELEETDAELARILDPEGLCEGDIVNAEVGDGTQLIGHVRFVGDEAFFEIDRDQTWRDA